jgi:hypothetical protein
LEMLNGSPVNMLLGTTKESNIYEMVLRFIIIIKPSTKRIYDLENDLNPEALQNLLAQQKVCPLCNIDLLRKETLQKTLPYDRYMLMNNNYCKYYTFT